MNHFLEQLLGAAMSGRCAQMTGETVAAVRQNPEILLQTTPQGSTCLHISSSFGHNDFLEEVLVLTFGVEESPIKTLVCKSLLSSVNSYEETPLIVAVKSGHVTLASTFLRQYQENNIPEIILNSDINGDNALHHAIRYGHSNLALGLIRAESNLSKEVNKYHESPMYIAVMRGFDDVFGSLWEVPLSSDMGAANDNVLHAAVRNRNIGIIGRIMNDRPELAKQENILGHTPIQYAVHRNQTNVVRVLLEHDRSLAYLVNRNQDNNTLLLSAASRNHVDVAREILQHCPDAPYSNGAGLTILHQAVIDGHVEFVEFVLRNRQLHKLITMRDSDGYTALHYAVKKCNPKIVRALLTQKEIDVRIYDNMGRPAFWQLIEATDSAKSLNWNEVFMQMSEADSQATNFYLRQVAMNDIKVKSMQEIKSLTGRYTNNTSLVAILIATITFAAPFTLPGGYGTDTKTEGHAVMARKHAFKAFLISDTLAMCSSLAVAFLCILTRWEDLKFLLYYRSVTKNLMWFALIATNVAFATGLYTVVAPSILWLAILLCGLSISLPFFTYLLSYWPLLKLQYRLGCAFKFNLLDMV